MKINSLIICCLILILSSQMANSQTSFTGHWKGIFMKDFKADVNVCATDRNDFEGNIRIFVGENMIQDDKITDIDLLNNKFTFYIPAKETSFEGSFNEQMTEIFGMFNFPDGSKHAIHLTKNMERINDIEKYTELKDKHFSSDELISDFEFLYLNLKKYHPRLYAFTSRNSMDRLAERLKIKIDGSLTLVEFYLLASRLTDAVHCSHTGVRLPATYQDFTKKYGHYFPFRLFFAENKAFYIAGCAEAENLISPGQEIIRINNMTISKLIEHVFYFIPSEAFNTTTKYNGINKKFNQLFYYLSDSEEFTVEFKNNDSTKCINVSSINLEDVNLIFETDATKIEYKYVDKIDMGILKIPTFAIKNMDYYFYRLDSIFKDLQIKHAQNLILDLRNNDGGHPIFAAQLFSYLTNKDFIYFRKKEKVKEFDPLYNTMHPNLLNFRGKLFVLVNGGCLSTTGHLISLLKSNTNALFVGEEPGSTFRCNNFSIQVTLPNTGIELNVPRATFETTVTGFSINEPFPLDHKVQQSIDEILMRKDAFLEKVMIMVSE